ncbi:PPC domain-containing DNA-binding protein [Ferrimonas lipolytica]|uniref:DUF296 domain-containing protein n=1 Tax=Ferrimonas lipolytica TaxID=2724191 RepID=A0A6H1UJB4_9GAMM|nr:DUF296 domain-containing protein [Ferrimonas lipolytica]QIZ78719.1 DUF296 domain-containing protein [Ferrimonas lipolytica]
MSTPLNPNQTLTSDVQYAVLRLLPGQELLQQLDAWLQQQQVGAAFIASAVGSLSVANLRFAAQPEGCVLTEPFEVHALSGTLDADCSHLHISLSNAQGQMVGGHVLSGCVVRTTLELVIGILPALKFERRHCHLSGYPELSTSKLNTDSRV